MMSPSFPSPSVGFKNLYFTIPKEWIEAICKKDWEQLDQLVTHSLSPSGSLRKILETYGPFSSVEHILALRHYEEDEEGIWHDDGSRDLAFSLSLNLDSQGIQGGELSLREKGTQRLDHIIGPRPLGSLTLFATGSHKWEHKTGRVLKGQRLVLAGWLTK